MNRLAPSLLLVLGFLVATGASARADEGVGPLGLTEDESARLEQGFLITHPKAERRGDLRLVGGTAFQLIDLPPKAVWQGVIQDPSRYQFILPCARESRETARESEADRTVFIRHAYGPASAEYHVRMHFDPATHTVMFRMADDLPHSIVAGWGFFRLHAWEGGRTLVSWGVLVDPGHGLLIETFLPRVRVLLLRVPLKLRRYLGFSDPVEDLPPLVLPPGTTATATLP